MSRFAPLLLAGIALAQNGGMVTPKYSGRNELVRPEGYRDWKFVGANVGMGYNENVPRRPTFHNVFIQPQAYKEFAASGKFPDKTMLVMEVLSIGSSESINRHGQFQDRLIGIEVALKDQQKFPEKWAYFNFIGTDGKPLATARPFPKDACWKCHNDHGANDNVFVQFYPVLKEVAPKR
ncbi:MAG: cytochrome P460 family protein [Bryobacteraceae bacterium]